MTLDSYLAVSVIGRNEEGTGRNALVPEVPVQGQRQGRLEEEGHLASFHLRPFLRSRDHKNDRWGPSFLAEALSPWRECGKMTLV